MKIFDSIIWGLVALGFISGVTYCGNNENLRHHELQLKKIDKGCDE